MITNEMLKKYVEYSDEVKKAMGRRQTSSCP